MTEVVLPGSNKLVPFFNEQHPRVKEEAEKLGCSIAMFYKGLLVMYAASLLKAGDSVGELHRLIDIAEHSYNAEKVAEDALKKMREE